MHIVLCRIGLEPAFNGVQFDMALLYTVLAWFGTAAWAGGWAASLLLQRRFFNTISSASAQSLTENTQILSLLSDICFAYTARGKYWRHKSASFYSFCRKQLRNSCFTFPDRTCSFLEEVSFFFNFTVWISNEDWKVVFHWRSRFTYSYAFVGNVLGYPLFSREFI